MRETPTVVRCTGIAHNMLVFDERYVRVSADPVVDRESKAPCSASGLTPDS